MGRDNLRDIKEYIDERIILNWVSDKQMYECTGLNYKRTNWTFGTP